MKNIRALLNGFERFWFADMTSKGFGLMRVFFGTVVFIAFLWQWSDVAHYYSDAGMLPRELIPSFLRHEWRFSVLDYIGHPDGVFFVYLLLLTCLALVTLGILTKPALIISTILIFSFHERFPTLLAGGDTVMRHLTFFLVLAPCHRSFSLWSYKKRLDVWLKGKPDPQAKIDRMPMWPYRLLLWQFFILYMASAWTKMLGKMWEDGSALEIVLHHEHFLRFPVDMMIPLWEIGKLGTHFTLIAQMSWAMLLIGPVAIKLYPPSRYIASPTFWRRFAIISNTLVHLMIFILMDVGIFSLMMFAGFLGVLRAEDFDALRRLYNFGYKGKIVVLYDGHCGLCLRSVFFLHVIDWLRRLELIDFRNTTARKKHAGNITLSSLDRALHIKLPNGRYLSGFSAFRRLSWHLPLFWLIAPLLYIPGMKIIGDMVYATIAARRKTCNHKECRL